MRLGFSSWTCCTPVHMVCLVDVLLGTIAKRIFFQMSDIVTTLVIFPYTPTYINHITRLFFMYTDLHKSHHSALFHVRGCYMSLLSAFFHSVASSPINCRTLVCKPGRLLLFPLFLSVLRSLLFSLIAVVLVVSAIDFERRVW